MTNSERSGGFVTPALDTRGAALDYSTGEATGRLVRADEEERQNAPSTFGKTTVLQHMA